MKPDLRAYPYVLPPDNFWPRASIVLAFLCGMLAAWGVVVLTVWVMS